MEGRLTQNVITELRELQAHAPELVLCLGAKSVRSGSPEIRHGSANCGIVLLSMRIHIAGVCDLAFRCGVDAMNLRARKGFERRKIEGLCEGVDSSVLQQLVSRFINERSVWVALEVAGPWDLPWEVISGIEEFEEASHGVEIFVNQINAAFLDGQLAFVHYQITRGRLTETSLLNFAAASANQGLCVSKA